MEWFYTAKANIQTPSRYFLAGGNPTVIYAVIVATAKSGVLG